MSKIDPVDEYVPRVGDTVILASGGPEMVVGAILGDERIAVAWPTGESVFDIACVRLVRRAVLN